MSDNNSAKTAQSLQENVDLKEIEKFESIASRWWDLEGEFKPLHQINPLRLSFIEEHSAKLFNKDLGLFSRKIVDVGCGGGILSHSMAAKGADVTGIDMGQEPLKVAKLHALETGVELTLHQCTAEQHAAENPEQYDVVTCMEMLEHVPDPSSVVQACASLVKPGGMVFFSTINRTKKAWLLMILAAEHIAKMLPKGTHEYDKFIKPSELLSWTDKAGLHYKTMKGVHYVPVLDYFKTGHNVDVNYMLCCQKPF